MKKLLFLLLAVIATCSISCTRLNSQKVDPRVIGTAYLQYDAENNFCYAEIDTVKYPVSKVLIPSKNGYSILKTSQIMHIEGVNVTLFTSPHLKGVHAVVGRQNETLIKENCVSQINFYIVLGVLLAIVFAIVGVAIYEFR